MELEVPGDKLDFNILDFAFRSCDRILNISKKESNALGLHLTLFLIVVKNLFRYNANTDNFRLIFRKNSSVSVNNGSIFANSIDDLYAGGYPTERRIAAIQTRIIRVHDKELCSLAQAIVCEVHRRPSR